MGAGSTHSLPLMVMNHRMQQPSHPVSRILPLKETRRAESGEVLFILHAVLGRGPSSVAPSGIEEIGQCDHCG